MATFLNGCLSDLGYPKDQSLAPLLFLMYVDELHKIIQHSNIKLFADDIALYKKIVSPSDRELLHDNLSKIYEWCRKWLLRVNLMKCESIYISYKHLPPLCSYFLGNQPKSVWEFSLILSLNGVTILNI